MPNILTPVFVRSPSGFAATLDITVDLGTQPDRALLLRVFSAGDALGGNGIDILSATLDTAGANLAMTAAAQITSTSADVLNTKGKLHDFWISGASMPTGVKTVRVTLANGNSIPHAWAVPLNDALAIAAPVVSAGFSVSPAATVPSATGHRVVTMLNISGGLDTYTIAATAPATQLARVLTTTTSSTPNALEGALWQAPGAASTAMAGTMSSSYAWATVSWSVTGTAPAAVAGPAAPAVAENSTAVGTYTASVAGTWSLTGVDAARFVLTAAGDNLSATLAFNPAPNREAATDVGANNVYDVTVNCSSTTALAVAVTVTNVVELPGAPTALSATAGNAQATVSFSAPAANGSPAITGYTVTSSPGGFTGTGSASPITVTGLTNGTAYTFTATATNVDGTGSASSASNSVTPAAVSGTVTISGLKNGTGTLLASTSLPNVVVIQRNTRALLLAMTNQTTDVSANLVLSNPALSPGVAVQVVAFSADGTQAGAWPATVV